MPSRAATRIELAVYVEPEYADAVRAMAEDDTEDSLLLDVEKLIGIKLDHASGASVFTLADLAGAEYGEGVAEVFVEDVH